MAKFLAIFTSFHMGENVMNGNLEYCGLSGYCPDARLQRYIDAGFDESIKACKTEKQLIDVLKPVIEDLRANAAQFKQKEESLRTAINDLRYHIYFRELSVFSSETVYGCIRKCF